MTNIAIEKLGEATAPPSFNRASDLAERIQRRAYEIFEGRGGSCGCELDDWLQAEHEVMKAAESELVEKDGQYEVQMAVSGFEPNEVHVSATPGTLTVSAETTHSHKDAGIEETSEKSLFRQFDLPSSINVNEVSAEMDKGVLKLVAAKAKAQPIKKTAAA